MILTPLFVKNSIDNYNNKMNREREQQVVLVGKINASANIISKAGRRDRDSLYTRVLDTETNTWGDYELPLH